jgi:hypothetical protein
MPRRSTELVRVMGRRKAATVFVLLLVGLVDCGGRLDEDAASSEDVAPAATADAAGSDAAADARTDSLSAEASSPPLDPYVVTFDSADCARRGDRQ